MIKDATTQEQRAGFIEEINANNAMHGIELTPEDYALQAEYIAGRKTSLDLLEHAKRAGQVDLAP